MYCTLFEYLHQNISKICTKGEAPASPRRGQPALGCQMAGERPSDVRPPSPTTKPPLTYWRMIKAPISYPRACRQQACRWCAVPRSCRCPPSTLQSTRHHRHHMPCRRAAADAAAPSRWRSPQLLW